MVCFFTSLLFTSLFLQTKSVKDLARLSLDTPEYLSVHSEAATPTPLKLTQAYMVVSLGQKMDVLWGFLKSHLTAKTIVFLSTCKQVRGCRLWADGWVGGWGGGCRCGATGCGWLGGREAKESGLCVGWVLCCMACALLACSHIHTGLSICVAVDVS